MILLCDVDRRCVSSKVLENIGSADKLEGFDQLKPEDQERVEKAFEDGSVAEFEEAEEKVGREEGLWQGKLLAAAVSFGRSRTQWEMAAGDAAGDGMMVSQESCRM